MMGGPFTPKLFNLLSSQSKLSSFFATAFTSTKSLSSSSSDYIIKLSDNNWWGLAPTVIGIGGAIAP